MSCLVALRRKLRVLSVFGTRPEAIKMAPVVRALSGDDRVDSAICVTGQHRQMLDDVCDLFGIAPDYDLDVMRAGQGLTTTSAAILERLGPVLDDVRPDWVVVQGDTTTAAIGSLAAFYAGARIAHVEAGLRSHTPREPFPEEANRRIVGAIADLHLAPTAGARENLLREGVSPYSIKVTGNPVIDALLAARRLPLPDGSPIHRLPTARQLLLVTAHRRESFGAPLEQICDAVLDVLERVPGLHVALPVHPNPAVRETVEPRLGGHPHVTLLPPLPYRDMVEAISRATVVLTDSGGIQEEAPALGKPVLVLRGVTEREEGVAAGTVRLVGTQRARIVREVLTLLGSPGEVALMSRRINPYGDGRSAERIVAALLGDPVEEWAGHVDAPARPARPRRAAPAPRLALPALTWDVTRF